MPTPIPEAPRPAPAASPLPDDANADKELRRFRELQLRLFDASVLKQAKWRALSDAVGPVVPRRALDLGADNGVISWLLRDRGGEWTSADLTDETVASIRRMVGNRVDRLHGPELPYADGEFDLVVVIDLLEHLDDDRALLSEIGRVLRTGGRVVLNVPRLVPRSVLRRLRHAVGLTDAWHGHVHAGYDEASLRALLPASLRLVRTHGYSRTFSHALDTALNWAWLRGSRGNASSGAKGMVVTGGQLREGQLRTITRVRPLMRSFTALDAVLPWHRGYMLLAELVKASEPSTEA